MATDAATIAPPRTSRTVLYRLRRADPYRLAVARILAVQAVAIGAVFGRGWYYQDDLDLLAAATGRKPGWDYLTLRVNDHLTPGMRLEFWLLHPLGLDAYWLTILLRIVGQAIATVLLYRLMVRLTGARPLVLWVLGAYALSPLLMGAAWLSCAANVVPAQALTLAGYLALLRYLDGGRLRSAAGAGLAFGAAATFLELSMINAALIVPLALGFAYEGRLRDRLRAALRQWRGWLLAALPLALFVAGFVAGGYGGSARPIRAGTLARFTWEQWSQTIAPMAVGGPWHWFSVPGVYFPVTDPPEWGIWLTEAVAALAVIGSIARSGLRVLVAWSLPVAFTLLCSAALVAGRFHQFGYLSAHSITYAFGAAVPCALAVVLAFPATPPTSGRRATGQRQSGDAHRPSRWTRLAVIAGAAAVLTGAVFSARGFLDYWTASPTHKYVDTLRGDLDRQPGVSLFDSPLPSDVLAFVESHHSLSDLLPLLGRRLAVDVSQDGHVVDEHGHVVPAIFSPAAVVNPDVPGRFCNFPLTGRRELTLRLETVPVANAWYLELQFFQQHASVVRVWAVDEHGRRLTPIGGDEQVIRTTLGVRYLRLATARPAVIHIRSDAEATNVCFTSVRVGAPSAVLGAK